jgi:hypothetical protein
MFLIEEALPKYRMRACVPPSKTPWDEGLSDICLSSGAELVAIRPTVRCPLNALSHLKI